MSKLLKQLLMPYRGYRSLMRSLLTPDEIYECVEDIQLGSLRKKGFNTFILDLDNTILTYDKKKLSLQKLAWIDQVKESGFQIFLVSNNIRKNRVKSVAESINVEGLYFACKPLTYSIRDLVQRHQIDLSKCVMIGDQLFTDVIAGNWLGVKTVLVDPMDKKTFFVKVLQREIELYILKQLEVLPVLPENEQESQPID